MNNSTTTEKATLLANPAHGPSFVAFLAAEVASAAGTRLQRASQATSGPTIAEHMDFSITLPAAAPLAPAAPAPMAGAMDFAGPGLGAAPPAVATASHIGETPAQGHNGETPAQKCKLKRRVSAAAPVAAPDTQAPGVVPAPKRKRRRVARSAALPAALAAEPPAAQPSAAAEPVPAEPPAPPAAETPAAQPPAAAEPAPAEPPVPPAAGAPAQQPPADRSHHAECAGCGSWSALESNCCDPCWDAWAQWAPTATLV